MINRLNKLADRLERRARMDFGDMDINDEAGKVGEVLMVTVGEIREMVSEMYIPPSHGGKTMTPAQLRSYALACTALQQDRPDTHLLVCAVLSLLDETAKMRPVVEAAEALASDLSEENGKWRFNDLADAISAYRCRCYLDRSTEKTS
jgi:hypothetical protein